MTQPDVFRHLAWSACLVISLNVSGCRHTEPVESRTYGSDQPFNPGFPVQLTLNRGPDRRAAWLPDGSGIVYSSQRPGTRDNDICLAVLPPSGGRQRSLICDLSPNGVDLTEAIESPAPDANGRLAFVGATSAIGARVPDHQALELGTLAAPATRTTLVRIPYTLPGRRTHSGVSQVRWLSPGRIVYLGEAVNVITPCQFCEMDTLRSGLDVVWVSVEGATPHSQAVPGTDNASGVSPGSSEDEIYYTLAGDTRVYRQTLSSGQVLVVHDFGAAGIARDVHVVGHRMAAVVGGVVRFTDDPRFGPTQWDSGGIVHLVNLQDGSDIALSDPADLGLYRRPQLSPDGSELITERYPFVLSEVRDSATGILIRVDTLVARVGDLYLFRQP